MKSLVLVCVLSSCVFDLDYNHRGIENVDPDFNMPTQRKALFLFERQVNEYFGTEQTEFFLDVEVYYVVDTCQDIAEPSFELNGQCVGGVAFNCQELFVAVHEPVVCNSALVHEFAHCLSMEIQELTLDGYGDSGHKGEIWGLVDTFNKDEACPRGW